MIGLVSTGSKLVGLGEAITAATVWGTVAVLSLLSGLPSPVFVFFRVLIGALFLLPLVMRAGRSALLHLFKSLPAIASAVFLLLNWVLFFLAVGLVPVATAEFLYYTGQVFAVLLGMIFLRESVSWMDAIALLLAAVGASVMFGQGIQDAVSWAGLAVALLSGVSYGALAVSSKVASKDTNLLHLTAFQLVFTTVALSPALLLYQPSINSNTLIIVAVVGVIHTAAALILWYDSLKRLPVSSVSVLTYIDPLVASYLAYLVLNQVPIQTTLVGGAMIVTAGIVTTLKYAGRAEGHLE